MPICANQRAHELRAAHMALNGSGSGASCRRG
eukprot:CAMPEP_0176229794 /NCGR_PEP_ID=MMETSP0121_2-20121125/23969_1 /TAXON_ID=160619 /ORGANISM="Kryptoperidinium foliaceum, Strain CCMP 1326" /LENGTH=31 /DNA_ID= /DNA_START= /DNA_END= /DNA_ORIENTATION=